MCPVGLSGQNIVVRDSKLAAASAVNQLLRCNDMPYMGLPCAVGLLSRAEVLAAAAAMQGDTPAQTKSQALSQNDVESMQHLLLQSTKVLANLQEVLRKDNRDIAIMADFQQTNGVSRMVP